MSRDAAAEVTLRPASPADEPAVTRCVMSAYERWVADIGRPPAPMLADYGKLIDDGLVQVAVEDAGILGVIVMWPEPDHLYVDNVAVVPEAQGRGVGALLLDAAVEEARRHGRSEIRLYTNEKMTTNLTYYPRHGYRETHGRSPTATNACTSPGRSRPCPPTAISRRAGTARAPTPRPCPDPRCHRRPATWPTRRGAG